MNPLVRAFFASTVIVVAVLLLILSLSGWSGGKYGFAGVRVVNDTRSLVRVQPCWDPACNDIVGLHEAVLPAGASKRVSGEWVNNFSSEIVVGVLTPRAEPMHFTGCLVQFSQPGAKETVFHVSREGVCPTADGGGGG